MNEETPFQFKCAECGKLFDPDPDSMVELTWIPDTMTEEEAEKAEDAGIGISAEQLADLGDEELAQIGINREIRDQMLSGEEVTFGGLCICTECQDRMLREQHGERDSS